MDNQLISVLVAAYNVEDTLPRCLNSIAAQTYTNIEIVIVDDGSTDGTPAICDEFAARDQRARVIHQENGGLSAVRNVGLAAARGGLVAFADGDDELMPTMLEDLFVAMGDTGADIVYCDWHTNKVEEGGDASIDVLSRDQFMPLILTDQITSHAWNKLYRKSVWDGIEFPLGRVAQDMAVMHRAFDNAKRVAHLKKPLYLYYAANPNNTSNKNKKKLKSSFDRAYAIEDRYEFANRDWPGVADEVFRQLAGFKVSSYYKAAVAKDAAAADLRAWLLANKLRVRASAIGRQKRVLARAVGTPLEPLAVLLIKKTMEV